MNNSEYSQIARAMELAIRLPQDDSLVHIVGTGSEKNNLEALGHWVSQQTELLDIQPAHYRLEKLIQRLRSTIDELNEQFYP